MESEHFQTPHYSGTEHKLINGSTFYKFKLTIGNLFVDALNNSDVILDLPYFLHLGIVLLKFIIVYLYASSAHIIEMDALSRDQQRSSERACYVCVQMFQRYF